jgi:Xaa-Pro aminopeptidase
LVGGDFAVDESSIGLAAELAKRRIAHSDLRAEVDEWRSRKSAQEVIGLREATRIASVAARSPERRRAETDFAIVARVESLARASGAQDCLCLIGGGWPDVVTEATGAVIEPSEPFSLEVTVVVDGFCSQVCVTHPAEGSPPELAREVCVSARRALTSAMRPGASIDDVVAAGDAALAERGLLHAKIYDFGHGVGCEVPEQPRLLAGCHATLEEGMVVVAHVGLHDQECGAAFVGGPVLISETGAIELGEESP